MQYDIVRMGTAGGALALIKKDADEAAWAYVAYLENTTLMNAVEMRDALNAMADSQTPDVKTKDLIDTDPRVYNPDGSFDRVSTTPTD